MRWLLPTMSICAIPLPAIAQTAVDRVVAKVADPPRCAGGASDELLVCGKRDDDRHRLTLPRVRDFADQSVAVAGEPSRASAESPYLNGCGIFAGQRRCSKREALAYGYGGGRDPITAIGRVARKIADPDAEVGATWQPPTVRRD